MTLRITRPIFALSVRLVHGFVVYSCSGCTGVSEVGVNVRDMDDKPRAGHVQRLRRIELMLNLHAVEPNYCSTGSNFTMNGLAVSCALDTSRFEPKYFNKEVMSCLNIAVY
jgi:hypothetical protein